MFEYLSLDIICSLKLTIFLELRSRKTVRFSEQIMSADKYYLAYGSYCLYIYLTNWICQKVPAEMVKTSQFCCRDKVQKATLHLGLTVANQPPTAHCGTTVTGDQKQTINQA